MARPFANVLVRHPRAVVLLEQDAVELGAVERDFEWFDTVEGMNEFVTNAKEWADEDVTGYGKSNHLIVAIETISIGKDGKGVPTIVDISAHGREADDLAALEAQVRKNPVILIEPPTVKGATKKATKAPAKKVQPKVGARKATAAGQAVKVGAGAKVTPPKAEPAAAPARTAAGAKARAAAAAKKAAAPTPTPPPAAPARRAAVRPTGAARKAATASKDAAKKAAPTNGN